MKKENKVSFNKIPKHIKIVLAEKYFEGLTPEERNILPQRKPLHLMLATTLIIIVALSILFIIVDNGTSYFNNEQDLAESISVNSVPSRLNNISLPELISPKFVDQLNSSKDTIYQNKKTGEVKCYSYQGKGCVGFNFSGSKLHKYLLSHLPDGYTNDSSVNLKTTGLTAEILCFPQGKDLGDWNLFYFLWYKGDIIKSYTDEDAEYKLSLLPDMRKYGYK